jgi:hypothetical protein
LVRIVAYEESAETQQALLQLGQGIELRLAGDVARSAVGH